MKLDDLPAYSPESSANDRFLLISCEHGGHRIPAPYRALFAGRSALLRSHRGYDAGALRLAREMAAAFAAPLHAATVSRLLIDLNRSPGHPRLYSPPTRNLAPAQRRAIFESCYRPYRDAVGDSVAAALGAGRPVLHVSCHSFTPVLDGKPRKADLGLLYDPRNGAEARLCRRWQARLQASLPGLAIRRNAPYRGTADGLTSSLRRRFAGAGYAGIELEVNQRHVRPGPAWRALRRAIIDSLRDALAAGHGDRPVSRPAVPEAGNCYRSG